MRTKITFQSIAVELNLKNSTSALEFLKPLAQRMHFVSVDISDAQLEIIPIFSDFSRAFMGKAPEVRTFIASSKHIRKIKSLRSLSNL